MYSWSSTLTASTAAYAGGREMKAVINRPRSGQIEMKGLLAALPEQVTRQFMPTAFSVYSGSLAGDAPCLGYLHQGEARAESVV